ncbi:MAG: hypothetical protein IID39_10630, partial [Planctomycetes bacterium]|nr:hypothetical protein [Planctomycetota bacterium]
MSTKDDTNPGTQAVPVPVRYWWLKRILIAAGIVFVGLLCLRLWWGHVAHQRLQAEIDRIRAAGEPLFPEDFDPDPVPDKDNAAIFLRKAEAAITTPPDVELTINDIVRNPQLCVTRADDVAKLIDVNQEALSLLHKARSASGVDWGLRFRSPLIDMMFPSISGQRQLAKLSCAAAMYYHQHGDDAAAVEAIRYYLERLAKPPAPDEPVFFASEKKR